MKRKEFLSILLTAFAVVAVITVSAQPQRGREAMKSPELMAKVSSERMAKKLDLTDDQESQIYQINLKYCQERQAKRDQMRIERAKMNELQKSKMREMIAVLDDDQIVEFFISQQRGGQRKPMYRGGDNRCRGRQGQGRYCTQQCCEAK